MSTDKQMKNVCGASENDLLKSLQVSSQEVLEVAQKKGRSKCPKCTGSRMFYCYTCYVPVESVPTAEIPSVKLPVKIDIIKHPNETDGKSTAVHAKLLAYEDVTVYTYPCIPDYDNHKHETDNTAVQRCPLCGGTLVQEVCYWTHHHVKTEGGKKPKKRKGMQPPHCLVILVFPSPNSVSLRESLKYLTDQISPKKDCEPSLKRAKLENQAIGIDKDAVVESENLDCLKKVVFIDSTWNQTNKIISDERLQGLVTVEMTERKTCFWRHQKGTPDTYLSTIEAIYYFMVDYHIQILEKDYHGEYDNLLFFYSFMYKLIKNAKHAAGKL